MVALPQLAQALHQEHDCAKQIHEPSCMTHTLLNLLTPTLILVIAFLLVVVVLIAALSSTSNPYVRSDYLFSKAEAHFYFALRNAVQDRYLVFGKVRIADIITIKSGLSPKARMSALGRIAQKHLDYVLVHPVTLAPICAIELNDKSHDREDRSKRDQLLSKIFAKTEFPIVWIKASRSYDGAEILGEILQATAQKQSAPV